MYKVHVHSTNKSFRSRNLYVLGRPKKFEWSPRERNSITLDSDCAAGRAETRNVLCTYYEVKPLTRLNATIEVPGSKSYTNRALLVAALANGTSTLKNALFSDDINYMVSALKKFGITITTKGNTIIVKGTNSKLTSPKTSLYLGNAGTAVRFLTTFAALVPGNVTLTGNRRMQQRPIKDLLGALNQLGVQTKSNKGCPPVTILGGKFPGGHCIINAKKSSQYLSSLLLTAPYADKDIIIDISGKLVSLPFIDITLNVMKQFGVKVINHNYKRFIIPSRQTYAPTAYAIEGDASNASYFFAAAAITGGKVKVTNINPKTVQGDIKFLNVLKKMGCRIAKCKDYVEVKGNNLSAINIDMNSMPDVVQTLAIVALFADGTTKIRNVANLRIKETDRISALCTELRKVGADVKELKEGLEITPGKLHGAIIGTYDDHRMAMSFAIAGLKIPGIKIKNPNCVSKTFPEFWKKLEQLK